MTAKSGLGKRIEGLALEYKEASMLIEQAPTEEIKYLLAQYQKVLQQLTYQGLNPTITPLETLTKKVSDRLDQLLQHTKPEDAKQLEEIAQTTPRIAGTTFSEPSPTQKLKHLKNYDNDQRLEILLQNIKYYLGDYDYLEVNKIQERVYNLTKKENLDRKLIALTKPSNAYWDELYVLQTSGTLEAIEKIKQTTGPLGTSDYPIMIKYFNAQ